MLQAKRGAGAAGEVEEVGDSEGEEEESKAADSMVSADP